MSDKNALIFFVVFFLIVIIVVRSVISLRSPDEKERIKREAIDWKEMFDVSRMGKELVSGCKFMFKWAVILLVAVALILLLMFFIDYFKSNPISPMYIIIILLIAILFKLNDRY